MDKIMAERFCVTLICLSFVTFLGCNSALRVNDGGGRDVGALAQPDAEVRIEFAMSDPTLIPHPTPSVLSTTQEMLDTGDVMTTGECMANQYGVTARGVERAIGFEGQFEARQDSAAFQNQRFVETDPLRSDHADRSSRVY